MKLALLVLLAALFGAMLVACPGPKMPSGPPPEYEEPPAPSWLRDAGAAEPSTPAPAPAAADASAPGA